MSSTVRSRAIAIAALLAALSWVPAACGDAGDAGDGAGPGAGSSAPVTHTPDPAGPILAAPQGRQVVAEVDGVPVYDDCVRIQAEAHGLDARAALSECIDFELLAREAERRGYRRHPAVLAAEKNESVRRLLDADIVAPMPSVESVPREDLEAAYQRLRKYIYAPERRSIFHVYAAFETRNAPPGSDDDVRARELAQAISAALIEERGVTPERLLDTARQVAAGRAIGPVDKNTNEFRREVFWVYINKPDLPYDFSQAVFEIPEPGRVSRPTRSLFGWHVTLFLESEAPRMASVDQAAEWLFQRLRLERYEAMVERLSKDVAIQVDEEALARLHEADDAFALSRETPPARPAGTSDADGQ